MGGRRARAWTRVLLVTPIGRRLSLTDASLVMETGDTGEAAAGAAQTQLLPGSGPSLASLTRLHLGVQREETVVSLRETGIQTHFPANCYHRQNFWRK